jgi:hypothetical protein
MSGLLFAKNVRQLQTYLSDPLPLSDDRLFARRSYEEMLKNLNRRAQARDFDPNASEPRFRALFEAFVEQNLEAETLSRQREKIAAYEQGRTDIKMGIEFGIIPVPGRVAPVPDTIRPTQPIPTPIDPTTDEAPLAPRQSETSAASRTDTRLSVALKEYLTKRHVRSPSSFMTSSAITIALTCSISR